MKTERLPPVRPFALARGMSAAFTDRRGGISCVPYDSLNLGAGVGDDPSAVTHNRRLAAQACGVAPSRLVWMRQVQGNRVAFATADGLRPMFPVSGGERAPAGAPPGVAAAGPDAADAAAGVADPPVDAIFTDVPGLVLCVLVADCAPVLLADCEAGIVGAAHSGRPGTKAGVVPALLAAMVAGGADPARIHAAIGPAICGDCYEVPEALQADVAAAVPQTRCRTRSGTPGLDIRAGIAAQLSAAGVTEISRDPRCTAEAPELYSYRRDGRTGRSAGLVWIDPGSMPTSGSRGGR